MLRTRRIMARLSDPCDARGKNSFAAFEVPSSLRSGLSHWPGWRMLAWHSNKSPALARAPEASLRPAPPTAPQALGVNWGLPTRAERAFLRAMGRISMTALQQHLAAKG